MLIKQILFKFVMIMEPAARHISACLCDEFVFIRRSAWLQKTLNCNPRYARALPWPYTVCSLKYPY